MRCHVCSSNRNLYARSKVLGKYPVAYYRCASCGFIQTEEPYWLNEAYSDAITGSDLGLVSRNLRLSQITQCVIRACFNSQGRFLDYAGGYGLFVRLMRDAGFNFRWYDKYCVNLFARGFETEPDDTMCYDLVTAFELVEHMRAPLEEVQSVLAYSRNLLFTTEILQSSGPMPETWWYFGLDHGQHISFFTIDSLKIMARTLSMNFYTDGKSLHLFTEKRLSSVKFMLATCYGLAFLSNILRCGKNSLLHSDYDSQRQSCNRADQ